MIKHIIRIMNSLMTEPALINGLLCRYIFNHLNRRVYLGRSVEHVPDGSIVFFPYRPVTFACGISGIVSIKKTMERGRDIDVSTLGQMVGAIETSALNQAHGSRKNVEPDYLGGDQTIQDLTKQVYAIKEIESLHTCFENSRIREELDNISQRLQRIIEQESRSLKKEMGQLDSKSVAVISRRLESMKDIAWCLKKEICGNIDKIQDLLVPGAKSRDVTVQALNYLKNINAVLNSIDRLEVRGRDSAGMSLMFMLDRDNHKKYLDALKQQSLTEEARERASREVLINGCIDMQASPDGIDRNPVSICFTYKTAAEIGRLGDNTRFLREQIKNDPILHVVLSLDHLHSTISSHTRWASVGAITEANCHPVDNVLSRECGEKCGIIHVCLNGDIDNFQDLKTRHERNGSRFHGDITTDTKIIPLQIEKYIQQGHAIEEAFRLAVNDFEGSHAISMHTDLSPGKLFLAQKGSGQAIFVGMAENHYMPTSEVYGFIEETPHYLKMDGESVVEGKNGKTQGQIFMLDQESTGGIDGVTALYYDGTPISIGEKDIKHTEITSRDIDRQKFPHYFLKEISESPDSVEKTLENRWKAGEEDRYQYKVTLDENTFPESLKKALTQKGESGAIRRIHFVGQGTAGVAALACSDILNYYLNDPEINVSALKASELSGFKLNERDGEESMADCLVIAISQSGTTTDTNRTVDMVKERGAHTMAIVNRRDSDITFKVDGVMYTSSGRDVEMSVASTKAFYSQILAGTLLGLYIADLKKNRSREFVTHEIKQLLKIPAQMRKVLNLKEDIKKSAERLAVDKTYWAAVGSGPNKASADEIRIKLSELCYKTISSDFVEDKKHIDLSSEPLIIVCAAGTRESVIGDIIKDTAIFKAHKATPIVIASEGEDRFEPYADDVFHVPPVEEHFAPILNTLVGHIWGYYAALAINEGSRFLYDFQESIQNTIKGHTENGLDIYEVILEKSFKEKIAEFYNKFRRMKAQKRFPAVMTLGAASDLTLLLKYLSGKLPVSDFELDFGVKGTPLNMLNNLFRCLGESINWMARPVDAIKHQAKTVTVGTSRISEKLEGILFDSLTDHDFSVSQLINRNILVLKNLQAVVREIKGSICYRIGNLNLLGEPTESSTIQVLKKRGILESIPSRVETDNTLQGTKKIIVRQGNVYIGKGRKDGRSILLIPIISTSSESPNIIEYLLLLNISFRKDVPLESKIRALGGKHEHIKNIVQENSIPWEDRYLDQVEMEELFGKSAEKIAEFIVSHS